MQAYRGQMEPWYASSLPAKPCLPQTPLDTPQPPPQPRTNAPRRPIMNVYARANTGGNRSGRERSDGARRRQGPDTLKTPGRAELPVEGPRRESAGGAGQGPPYSGGTLNLKKGVDQSMQPLTRPAKTLRRPSAWGAESGGSAQ